MDAYTYLESREGSRSREALVESVADSYKLGKPSRDLLFETIKVIHTSSLLVDDVQDGTPMRRGAIAAHVAFGVGRTVCSAYLALFRVLCKLDPDACTLVVECLRTLHEGQARDLGWSLDFTLPSTGEYLEVVALKTGALFELVPKLGALLGRAAEPDTAPFQALGLQYQIRDDYKSLWDDGHRRLKGGSDDISERNVSYPLILLGEEMGFTTFKGISDDRIRDLLKTSRVRGMVELELSRRQSTIRDHFSRSEGDIRNEVKDEQSSEPPHETVSRGI